MIRPNLREVIVVRINDQDIEDPAIKKVIETIERLITDTVDRAEQALRSFETGEVYTPSNVTTTRTFDADATTLAELADVVGTLIVDLQGAGKGIVS